MFTNMYLTDVETCYKLFRREVIQSLTLEESRFTIEPEITAKLARLKPLKLYEVAISYHGRTYSDGKKLPGKTAWLRSGALLNMEYFENKTNRWVRVFSRHSASRIFWHLRFFWLSLQQ